MDRIVWISGGSIEEISTTDSTIVKSCGFTNQLILDSRHPSPLPHRLGKLALRLIIRIPLIDWKVMLSVTRRILDTRSFLQGSNPFPQPGPDFFILASLALDGHPETVFEVVKDPESNLWSSKLAEENAHSYLNQWAIFELTIQGATTKSNNPGS